MVGEFYQTLARLARRAARLPGGSAFRPTCGAGDSRRIRRQLLANGLPHDIERRAPVNVLQQGVIDERLVIAAAGLVYDIAEII